MFVKRAIRLGARYDVIVLDAFEADYIPEHLSTVEFLGLVKRLLATGGTLAANTWAAPAVTQREIATYQAVFGQVWMADMPGGNRILLAGGVRPPACPGCVQRPHAETFDAVSKAMGFGFAAADVLGLVRPAPVADARLALTDKFNPANILLHTAKRDGARHE
jgi:spermidine synthase